MKHFLMFFKKMLEKMILPYHCVLCLETSNQKRDLCFNCQIQLPTSSYVCMQCGLAFSHKNHSLRCGHCIQQPPNFDNTIVGFNYQTPVDNWLKQFKFHKKGLYARILTGVFIEKITPYFQQHPEQLPQLLIAMPLHWRRRLQRGFNQAHVIAHYIHKKLHIPLAPPHCVTRIKYTQAQSGLNQQARRKNMHGVFFIKKLHNLQHVAIIDDVVTTGSTVNELAKSLKLYGISQVSVWALARVN